MVHVEVKKRLLPILLITVILLIVSPRGADAGPAVAVPLFSQCLPACTASVDSGACTLVFSAGRWVCSATASAAVSAAASPMGAAIAAAGASAPAITSSIFISWGIYAFGSAAYAAGTSTLSLIAPVGGAAAVGCTAVCGAVSAGLCVAPFMI
eukprot:TRINITY_DN19367_c0_g1::TRINITY_DN19367_c0_g1_i1::g.7863::m.7863 TRINITY_DN19367_c0_g1::TRINITY_DN19367_c0_g1_i1::g.7863  ORF type:complete len:165 (-),score=20.53 TRINITY_DN19367_c0_g1_i1:321-779(-)